MSRVKKLKKTKSEEPEKEESQKVSYADSFTGSFSIPENKEALLRILRISKLNRSSLHNLFKMRSGSKVLKKQFVLFRSIWPFPEGPGDFADRAACYNLEGVWKQALHLVNDPEEAKRYLALVNHQHLVSELQEGDPQWAGSWMPVLRFQARCIAFSRRKTDTRVVAVRQSTRRTVSSPMKGKGEDEAIVNAALVLLLNAAASLVRSSQCEFSMVRVPFIAKFNHAKFKALTDGALWVRSTEAIRGIIEVKKARRSKIGDKVTMQEAAELVGWIMNSQPWEEAFSGYKCLISEDGDEVWLLFAKPTETYAAYLRDGTLDDDALLTVERYGPYKVDDDGDMLHLLYAVVAIYLQAVAFDNVSQA
ncbi:hypothetical protein BO82DRAFT_370630 [Aspergillus uvarum CBS 121591]|uniref:Uncharacterized protein n=1 Tax=Aspergillus uvarum CBS 121591 TaxID=1448315 RepID=A0A319CQC7_9EURO|nr:hypothetical protein BO82DRAFT_370630 [Aspergillus uvarum CBS 121591]PYH86800.1 hypothetical protein BO82DRAFT_370630 [Aspergillus uvarum CBS 121591]